MAARHGADRLGSDQNCSGLGGAVPLRGVGWRRCVALWRDNEDREMEVWSGCGRHVVDLGAMAALCKRWWRSELYRLHYWLELGGNWARPGLGLGFWAQIILTLFFILIIIYLCFIAFSIFC